MRPAQAFQSSGLEEWVGCCQPGGKGGHTTGGTPCGHTNQEGKDQARTKQHMGPAALPPAFLWHTILILQYRGGWCGA